HARSSRAPCGLDISLAALQQHDPYISSIVDVASQVALYTFGHRANEWVRRAAPPRNPLPAARGGAGARLRPYVGGAEARPHPIPVRKWGCPAMRRCEGRADWVVLRAPPRLGLCGLVMGL
uniref:5'-(N(7)-methylguanosine 5'-triphospho)-[mRNA] hydrolase n=1 Tax=Meleagris gallopavo TaxID=9103 RepID=A0A803YHH6_MELGA